MLDFENDHHWIACISLYINGFLAIMTLILLVFVAYQLVKKNYTS